jgi:Fe-S cluster biogenesis protein NfuA
VSKGFVLYIRGEMNTMTIDQGLIVRIQAALDSVRPFLHADGGDVELVEVTPDLIARVRLTGACSNCEMSHFTMKAGLEEGIRKAVPEIISIEAVI